MFRTGAKWELQGDPLVHLEKELEEYKFIELQGAPPFTGASHGFSLARRLRVDQRADILSQAA